MTGIRLEVVGGEALQRAFAKLNPSRNPEMVSRALRRIGLETTDFAKRNLIRGGRFKVGGRLANRSAVAGKLTSRTGAGRNSISANFGALPREVSVGSDLTYMRVHETGGTFTIPTHQVGTHTRTVAFGRTVSPFKVPAFSVSAHPATFPRRPWLEPAVDKMVPTRAQEIITQEWERQL